MKILAIEKDIPGVKDEQFTKKLLKKEAIKAWEYYESGVFSEMYFTKEDKKAVPTSDASPKMICNILKSKHLNFN
jgi:hypothetical protein